MTCESIDLLRTATIFKEFAVGAAALATAFFASKGLNTWRKEQRGKAYFEAARTLARATFRLRDMLDDARAPFIAHHEFPKVGETSDDVNTPKGLAEGLAFAYRNRWQHVLASLQEFDAAALEAEALWGKDARHRTDELRECVRLTNNAVELFIRDTAENGRILQGDPKLGRMTRERVSRAEDGEFTQRIESAVSSIENYLRGHLER